MVIKNEYVTMFKNYTIPDCYYDPYRYDVNLYDKNMVIGFGIFSSANDIGDPNKQIGYIKVTMGGDIVKDDKLLKSDVLNYLLTQPGFEDGEIVDEKSL